MQYRYLGIYSIDSNIKTESSYLDITDAIASMQIEHFQKFPDDPKWEKVSGLIFDLEENKCYKMENHVWKEKYEIPETYRIAKSFFLNK